MLVVPLMRRPLMPGVVMPVSVPDPAVAKYLKELTDPHGYVT